MRLPKSFFKYTQENIKIVNNQLAKIAD